jgi:hypothetical protein
MTVVALVALVALVSCGRFVRSTSMNTTTTGDSTVRTLAPLATVATTGTVALSPPPAVRTATTRDRCAPPNQSVRDDPSGFRLILTIAPKQCVSRAADLSLQLEIENISRQPLQYDTNQTHFFDIIPEGDASRPSWSDTQCRGHEAHPPAGGPLTLAPGERVVRAQATYPGPKSEASRERCRVLEGSYVSQATFTWCPPGSVVNGVCDPNKSQTINSAPLLLYVS